MRIHTIGTAWLIAATVFSHAAEGERSVAEITASAGGSIVVVTRHGRDGKEDGVGAGFVVAREGLVATCLHVIDEARSLRVSFANGREYDVTEVLASDRKLDLAVLRIAATNVPALKLGDSDKIAQGMNVVAMGNPLGLKHSVVAGVVSARREIQGNAMIQLAIPIEPGNSGGPLLDRRGRVQGVLTLKHAFSENLGFAMPVNALKKLLDQPNPVPMSSWARTSSLDPNEWEPLMGAQWRRKAGAVHVDGPGTGFGGRSICLAKAPVPDAPYEVAVTVRLDDESGAAGLIFGADGGDRHYGFYPTGGQLRLTRFDGPNVFSWSILKDIKTPRYHPGEWNTIKVRIETNRIVGFVNGEQVLDLAVTVPPGSAGLTKFRQTTADFLRFKIGKTIDAEADPPQLRAAVARLAAGPESSARDIQAVAGHPLEGRQLLLDEASRLEARARNLRSLAGTAHLDVTRSNLLSVLNQPDAKADLFYAALLVAQLDNPDLDITPYRAEIKKMAAAARAETAATNDVARLDALTTFLFGRSGFHGSRMDYYNRANSYMNDVLDDREGLPITLAILYIELANAIGVPHVSGIPVPTRFMVKFAPPGGPERIIDVFDGGKVLTRSEAVELVADSADSLSEDDFKPAPKKAIILRMLRNLLGIAERTNASADALRYLDTILALAPESAADRLARAQLRAQDGKVDAAKEDVRWLLDHPTHGLDPDRLREWLNQL